MKELQSQVTNNYTSIIMAKIQNIHNTKCWQGCGLAGTLSFTASGNTKWHSHFKRVWQYLIKLNRNIWYVLLCLTTVT